MTSITTTILLKNLALWKGNVRKTEGSDTALAELAASIASVGIINPLTVFAKKGKHHIVAGGRRFAALQALRQEGRIDEAFEVPCTVMSEDHALEVSIAENVVREDMHPADEFEAFLKLSKDGASNADIAAKFGVTETVVARRLKLARVSPKIIKAYREGDIGLDCVMAYAVSEDVKRQLKVFKALSGYHAQDADSIRTALTEGEIDASDKRVRFVTLDAYKTSGGKTRRDLFADDDDASGIYIVDIPLLEELVAARLEEAASALRAEGWHWVEVRSDFGWDDKGQFRQLSEEPVPLPALLQDELDALGAEQDALYNSEDELTNEQSQRVDEIESRCREIEDAQEFAWPEGAHSIAGAVVAIGRDGKADITRGLVRPEDVKKLAKPQAAETGIEGVRGECQGAPGGLSAKLLEQLTRHRTAALAAELIDKPAIGLSVVAYCLALEIFADGKTCIHVSLREQSHGAVEGSPAYERIERARTHWGDTVPGAGPALWDWCLLQDRNVLIELITFCAALSIDAVAKKRGSMDFRTELSHADALAAAAGLDMGLWFTPTAANYFMHVSKANILDALTEAGKPVAPAWAKAKKSELAAIAEREIAGTGWQPAPLRAACAPSAEDVKNAA